MRLTLPPLTARSLLSFRLNSSRRRHEAWSADATSPRRSKSPALRIAHVPHRPSQVGPRSGPFLLWECLLLCIDLIRSCLYVPLFPIRIRPYDSPFQNFRALGYHFGHRFPSPRGSVAGKTAFVFFPPSPSSQHTCRIILYINPLVWP